MARCPLSLERLTTDNKRRTVFYTQIKSSTYHESKKPKKHEILKIFWPFVLSYFCNKKNYLFFVILNIRGFVMRFLTDSSNFLYESAWSEVQIKSTFIYLSIFIAKNMNTFSYSSFDCNTAYLYL